MILFPKPEEFYCRGMTRLLLPIKVRDRDIVEVVKPIASVKRYSFISYDHIDDSLAYWRKQKVGKGLLELDLIEVGGGGTCILLDYKVVLNRSFLQCEYRHFCFDDLFDLFIARN